MSILDFFKYKRECQHKKVSNEVEMAYCPTCGKLIENRWYLVRCECCGIKLKAILKNGEITAEENFCHNCGGKHFVAEYIPKINCIDINYAVLVKTEVETDNQNFTQSWTNINQNGQPHLLTQT